MLIDRAIEAISEKQSTWRPTELQRELGGLLPTDVGADAAAVIGALDQLADAIAKQRCVDISQPIPPDALLRRDGRPVTEAAIDRALTTQAILDQEHGTPRMGRAPDLGRRLIDPAAIDRSDVDLNIAQADAAARVAGDEQLVLIVGPAGTGKTTALRPAVAQLRAHGRPVFGVAPSAAAAEVLQDETGVAADTLDKLLIEHRLDRPPDHRYDLPAGSTVIVDEAGMMSTPKLAELAALADRKQWRVVLVGDPLQFSAVGRGGMFELLVDTYDAVELDRVHRFDNDWERDASLRLRRGDVEVAEVYDHHGRLHGGSVQRMRQQAIARWWTERQAGRTALLMSPTNETVVELNLHCQLQRIRAGELDPDGAAALAGRYVLFVGEEIATRKNDRRLLTDRGQMVRNRAEWTVRAIHRDLSITVEGASGTVRLPREYVAEHVDLAYARTGAGAQGRTVDVGILFLDRPTDVRNLYVPMTRGRSTNEVFVATTGEQTALDVVAQSIATDWIDRPALARQAELKKPTDIAVEIERPRRQGDRLQSHATDPRPVGRTTDRREVGPACRAAVPADEEVERVDRHRDDPRRVGWPRTGRLPPRRRGRTEPSDEAVGRVGRHGTPPGRDGRLRAHRRQMAPRVGSAATTARPRVAGDRAARAVEDGPRHFRTGAC